MGPMSFNLSYLPTRPKSSNEWAKVMTRQRFKQSNKSGHRPSLTLNGPEPCRILYLHNLSPPLMKLKKAIPRHSMIFSLAVQARLCTQG